MATNSMEVILIILICLFYGAFDVAGLTFYVIRRTHVVAELGRLRAPLLKKLGMGAVLN